MTRGMVRKTIFFILGIVIGAGFASGKEIVTFFADYGNYASFLLIIMMLLMFYIIFIFMRVGKLLKPKSVSDITKVVFHRYAKLIDFVIVLSLFIGIFAMLAGSDALAADVFVDYSFPYFGVLLSFLVIIIVSGGLSSILKVNGVLVPIMVVLVLGVAISHFLFGVQGVVSPSATSSFIDVGSGIFSTLLYTCMNMFTVGIIVAEMGKSISQSQANKISFGASAVLFLCIAIVLGALLSSSNLIISASMPMVRLAYGLGDVIGGVYSLIILFGIFTTVVALSFAMNNWLVQFIKDRLISISTIIFFAFIISRLGFSYIVELFYPIEGLFGLVFIVGVIGFYYKNRKIMRNMN